MDVLVEGNRPLRGQVAVVTGASRGIGEAVAVRLAGMGAHTVLVARRIEPLAEVESSIRKNGGAAAAMARDLTDAASIAALGETVAKDYGRCDILVNNAGIGFLGKPLTELPLAEWEEMVNLNLRAPYLMIRALAPLMTRAGGGHIVNISSLAGKNPLPGGAAYAATKWGLNGLSYSVAEELRQAHIRVTVIAPGSVNTSFNAGGRDRAEKPRDGSKMLQPEDVAHAVASVVTQAQTSFMSEILLRPATKP